MDSVDLRRKLAQEKLKLEKLKKKVWILIIIIIFQITFIIIVL